MLGIDFQTDSDVLKFQSSPRRLLAQAHASLSPVRARQVSLEIELYTVATHAQLKLRSAIKHVLRHHSVPAARFPDPALQCDLVRPESSSNKSGRTRY